MKIWAINFIILSAIVMIQASAVHAEEFNFSLDVSEAESDKIHQFRLPDTYQSAPSWRAKMQTTFLPGFLDGSGELIYRNANDNSSSGVLEWDKYLFKLGGSGKKNAFEYGLDIYSVGENYTGNLNSEDLQNKGKSGYESWLSLDLIKLQLKTRFSDYWANKRTHDQWLRVESKYALTTKPYTDVSFSYGLGTRWDKSTAANSRTEENSLHSMIASFSFVDEYLKFSTEVNRLSLENDLDAGKDYQKDMFIINSTFFPQNLLSLTSSYRYSENLQDSINNKRRLNNRESSLGVIYKLLAMPGQLKLTTAFNNQYSNDGYTDKDIVKFAAQFNWKLAERFTDLDANWTFDFQYKDIKDSINPATDNSNWSLNLLWRWSLS